MLDGFGYWLGPLGHAIDGAFYFFASGGQLPPWA